MKSIGFIMVLLPTIFSERITAAQSMRTGGLSKSPFHSLNLGLSTEDDRETVLKNRRIFFDQLNIDVKKIILSRQVHGTEILIGEKPEQTNGYDAIITAKKNPIVVSIADCTPVLIHDTKNDVVAAIHAGWRGTADEIVKKTLAKMETEFGTEGKNCKAFIGSCISVNHFEVGNEVAERFHTDHKVFHSSKKKFHVDLKKANFDQLTGFGLLKDNIEISPYCTVENNDKFFSWRKEKGVTGRMFACIQLK